MWILIAIPPDERISHSNDGLVAGVRSVDRTEAVDYTASLEAIGTLAVMRATEHLMLGSEACDLILIS